MGLRFWRSGFGFWVSGFGFRVSGFGFRFRFWGLDFRVKGLGFRAEGLGFKFRVHGFRFRLDACVVLSRGGCGHTAEEDRYQATLKKIQTLMAPSQSAKIKWKQAVVSPFQSEASHRVLRMSFLNRCHTTHVMSR